MNLDGHVDPRDDAELVRLARRDPAAFRIVYDRHVVRVHAFLLRRTGDAAAAFELTAETFARAWLSLGRFTDRGDGAGPWLFGIARNVLAGSVRDRAIEQRARRGLGLEAAEGVAAPRDAWLVGLDADLAAALAALPDAQRRAVEIRVLDGSDYAEVGRALEISPGAARVRVHRGLASLRRLVRGDRHPAAAAPPPLTRPRGDIS